MRIKSGNYLERGDTIIEVIFAMTIFALVAVSTLSVMNQGMNAAQRSLEITLVRQQIDAQAEALRYIRDTYTVSPSRWNSLVSAQGQASASTYGLSGNSCSLPSGGGYKPFILNARTAEVSLVAPTVATAAGPGYPPFPQVVYGAGSVVDKAYGIWIEAVPSGPLPSNATEPQRYIDFHIRTCWDGPGNSVPMTLGTIIRLFDPERNDD